MAGKGIPPLKLDYVCLTLTSWVWDSLNQHSISESQFLSCSFTCSHAYPRYRHFITLTATPFPFSCVWTSIWFVCKNAPLPLLKKQGSLWNALRHSVHVGDTPSKYWITWTYILRLLFNTEVFVPADVLCWLCIVCCIFHVFNMTHFLNHSSYKIVTF